ncbi:MAG: DUF1015 family protein [Chloroflexi bacterium]|nr:DUF1015 family protein [Chloroflexota bacterium]
MADIRSFKGIRYDQARVGRDVSAVVCPPYDVISSHEQAELYARHPHNMVQLELPSDEPVEDRYQRAASRYHAWLDDGTLVPEAGPALYAYLQTFVHDGAPCERRGVIAALRVEPWERRVVRAHERTLSGPKRDRFALMRACHANFSPIWCLYDDTAGGTAGLWRVVQRSEPNLEATDDDGVVHRVWVVSDPSVVREFCDGLKPSTVYIADGHHRFETAIHLQKELRTSSAHWSEDAASNFTMTYLVDVADAGLVVLGTHRLMRSPRPLDRRSLLDVLSRWFDVDERDASPANLLGALEQDRMRPAFGVWAPGHDLVAVARLRGGVAVPEELAPHRSTAWRRLDLAALHTLAIDQLFAEGTTSLSEAGWLTYSRDLDGIERAVAAGEADFAFLVRTTPVEQIRAVADAADLMPEKSTYFWPKPLSGLVIASLDDEFSAKA